jgi:nucleoside 2-deoxyribosyltransferase
MNIYLAGGFGNWRDQFRKAFETSPRINFLDPGAHGHVKNESAYTFLDLDQVNRADMLVAYLEPENPSLYGSSLEIGYAHAMAKPVVLIDALTPAGDKRSRYFGMARSVAQVVVPTIPEAIEFLESLVY